MYKADPQPNIPQPIRRFFLIESTYSSSGAFDSELILSKNLTRIRIYFANRSRSNPSRALLMNCVRFADPKLQTPAGASVCSPHGLVAYIVSL